MPFCLHDGEEQIANYNSDLTWLYLLFKNVSAGAAPGDRAQK